MKLQNLPQQVQLCSGWNVFVVFFHPCRVAGLHKTFQLFSISYGMAVDFVQQSSLWRLKWVADSFENKEYWSNFQAQIENTFPAPITRNTPS